MKPQWFDVQSIPFSNMWPDSTYWFPFMLNNKLFKGYFLYKGMDVIIDHNIEEVDLDQLDCK